jgi:Ca2+-binding EF-hand superfamily protein
VVADSYFKKFSRAEILEAFRRFDHNHDGYIEADELKTILSKLGRNFSSDEVSSTVAFNGTNGLAMLYVDSTYDCPG